MGESCINLLHKADKKPIMAQGKMTATDDDLINWMREQSDPAYVASEVAEAFDMSTEGVRVRLEALEKEGRLMSKKPSPRTVLWWLPEAYGRSSFSE